MHGLRVFVESCSICGSALDKLRVQKNPAGCVTGFAKSKPRSLAGQVSVDMGIDLSWSMEHCMIPKDLCRALQPIRPSTEVPYQITSSSKRVESPMVRYSATYTSTGAKHCKESMSEKSNPVGSCGSKQPSTTADCCSGRGRQPASSRHGRR